MGTPPAWHKASRSSSQMEGQEKVMADVGAARRLPPKKRSVCGWYKQVYAVVRRLSPESFHLVSVPTVWPLVGGGLGEYTIIGCILPYGCFAMLVRRRMPANLPSSNLW